MNGGPTGTLKPFSLEKTIKKIRVNSSYHSKDHRLPPGRTQLRHVVKDHTVDTHDHRRHRHKGGVGGETLGDFALLQGNKRQIDRDGRGQHVAHAVDGLVETKQMIIDVTEIVLKADTEDWHTTTEQFAGGVEHRLGGVLQNHQFLFQPIKSLDIGPHRLIGKDPFLDTFQLRFERIKDWKITIHHGIHEGIEHVGGAMFEQFGLLFATRPHVDESTLRPAAH